MPQRRPQSEAAARCRDQARRAAAIAARDLAHDRAVEFARMSLRHGRELDEPDPVLAEQILEKVSRKTGWVNEASSKAEALSILSRRIDPAPGTHSITYTSEIDDITITHTAHSREGFAAGAVIAAEWLDGKKGIFTMKDVLNL